MSAARALLRRLSMGIRSRLAVRAGPLDTEVGPDDRAIEALALRALRENDCASLGDLVERVSDSLAQANRLGAFSDLDVGVWRAYVCRQRAAEAVRRMVGRSLALEADGERLLATPIA